MKTANEMRTYTDKCYAVIMEDANAYADRFLEETASPMVEEFASKGCYTVQFLFNVSDLTEYEITAIRDKLYDLGYLCEFKGESIKITW